MSDYYIYKNGKIQKASLMEWATWFENVDNRRIEWTEEEDFCVSTVFLGLDHGFGCSENALLFETCILKGPDPVSQNIYRYATLAEAKSGHYAVVRALQGKAYDFNFLGEPSIMNIFFELMDDAIAKKGDDSEMLDDFENDSEEWKEGDAEEWKEGDSEEWKEGDAEEWK